MLSGEENLRPSRERFDADLKRQAGAGRRYMGFFCIDLAGNLRVYRERNEQEPISMGSRTDFDDKSIHERQGRRLLTWLYDRARTELGHDPEADGLTAELGRVPTTDDFEAFRIRAHLPRPLDERNKVYGVVLKRSA